MTYSIYRTYGTQGDLHGGEKGVEHALAGQEGIVARKLLGNWARVTHRPVLAHGEPLLGAIRRLDFNHVLMSINTETHERISRRGHRTLAAACEGALV
jgi:hypothetical protein